MKERVSSGLVPLWAVCGLLAAAWTALEWWPVSPHLAFSLGGYVSVQREPSTLGPAPTLPRLAPHEGEFSAGHYGLDRDAVPNGKSLAASLVPASSDALLVGRSDALSAVGVARRESSRSTEIRASTSARTPLPADLSHWPALPTLLEQLQRASLAERRLSHASADFGGWQEEALAELDDLRRAGDLHSRTSAQIVDRLGRLQQRGLELVSSLPPSPERDVLWQAAYALRRRVDVWSAARACLGRPELEQAARRQTAIALQHLRERLSQEPQAESWTRYLLCDDIAEALPREASPANDLARMAAERIAQARRDPAMRAWLNQPVFIQWEQSLIAWANLPIDVSELLHDVEALEREGDFRQRRALANLLDALQWTSAGCDLHSRLHDHYRNANLRLAINDQLIQRFAPPAATLQQPVRDVILGASVRGDSLVSATTRLLLTPSEHGWRVGVQAVGEVRSQTRAFKGPAIATNAGEATFEAETGVLIDSRGIHHGGARVSVDSVNELQDLQTTMDGVPLVGWLVRQAALHQYSQTREEARRQAESRISHRIEHQMRQQVSEQTQRVRDLYDRRVALPLEKLDLRPEVLELQTTPTQLIGRFRVLGAGQLGAHTPRPTAPANSWLELQVHESLINNVLEGLGLHGRRYELRDLMRQLARWWGDEQWEPGDEIPTDVFVQFADQDAVSLRVGVDAARLRLRFVRLETVKQQGYDDFEIHVDYRPIASGRRLILQRTGIVRVAGDRLGFRDRLPLRGIFAKVFASNRELDLLGDRLEIDPRLDGLEFRLCQLDDGWLNLSFGPRIEVAQQTP